MDPIVNLKQQIVNSSYKAQEGHIPSAFSIMDILWVLYNKILKIDPSNPLDPHRDYFILSKGHACLGLYSILANKGFFPVKEMDNLAQYNSNLGAHPNKNKIPGIEMSSGSLGHGLPFAVGVSLGLRIENNKSSKVYCIIGDGEANEGSIWESFLIAAHHKLSNLCCIIDYNHSTDRALKVGDLTKKLDAFDWETREINGHDHNAIYDALITIHKDKPLAVVANTIKGNGCHMIENNPEWHHKSPNEQEYEKLIRDLNV